MEPETRLRDPLTGVYSRASFTNRLWEEMEYARRYRQPLSLLLIDLDHFKSVNDGFGHARGDQVLVEFAQRLQGMTRVADKIFRYGGDEFAVLLPDTDMSQAAALAQRILENVRTTAFAGEPPLSLSLSMGIASLPQDGQTPEALFEVADQRHYAAKRAGRGRVVSADSPPTGLLPLEGPSRLLERDEALECVQRFLAALPRHKRGVLRVAGQPGSGRTRFLAEMAKNAALQGYAILAVRGTAALRNRLYGTLSDAAQEWDGLPPPARGARRWISAVQHWLPENGRAGMLITIDNPSGVDQASMELVRELFFAAGLPPIALAHTLEGAGAQPGLLARMPYLETVALAPLSLTGTRIWVRHSLQWEAPVDFLEWIHRETGGLPAHIRRGLTYLLEENVLQTTADGWRYRPDFRTFPLAAELAHQASGPPSNLPGGLLEFVGREGELRSVKELIQERGLVTLLGPGGIGKSRLAAQAAAESLEAFPDGVYFAPLAPLSRAEFLAPAIAETLRLSFSGGEEPKTQLLNYLRARALLLVLDNFEHVLEGTALLSEIQEQAPGVKLLVTSRERLHLAGEAVYELRQGLDCPEPPPRPSPNGGVETSAAGQLFVQRARRVQPDFALSPENRAEVARICRLVAGMPLGIELAAAWAGAFAPAEIIARIEANLAFLATDQEGVPERHRSLLAVLDSFWSLLSASEQGVLSRLSLFRGGFTADDSQEVAGASPFFLSALVSHSYLHRTPQGRYEMHELLRQYAGERLQAHPDEWKQTRDRHCDYYARFLHAREPRLRAEKGALDEVRTEIENVRASWRWAVAEARLDALEQGWKAFSAFLASAGFVQEGEQTFRAAVERLRARARGEQPSRDARRVHILVGNLLAAWAGFLRRLGRYDEAVAAAKEAVEAAQAVQDADPPVKRAAAAGYLEWGRAVARLGGYAEARTQIERGLELAQAASAHRLETEGLLLLGQVNLYEPDYAQAREHLQRALRLCREHGDRQTQANALDLLGVCAQQQGDYEAARDAYEQSLRLSREIGNRGDEVATLLRLGMVASDRDDYRTAQGYFGRCLRMAREFGDRWSQATVFNCLGVIAAETGDLTGAVDYFEQYLQLARETGHRRHSGLALMNLGETEVDRGEYVKGRAYLEQALQTFLEIGERRLEGVTRHGIGLLALRLGDYDGAREAFEQALRIAREIGDRPAMGQILARLGLLAHHERDDAAAGEYGQQALHLFQQIGERSNQALALTYLGHARLGLGRLKEAAAAYREGLALRREFEQLHLATESLAGLARIALAQDELAVALGHVEEILGHLETDRTLAGADEPLRVYLTCYRVLGANQDARAQDLLTRAHALLQEWAANISDEEGRRRFLEQVRAHREIIEAWASVYCMVMQ